MDDIVFNARPKAWHYVWCSAGKPINYDFGKWTVNCDVYYLSAEPLPPAEDIDGTHRLIPVASADELPKKPPAGMVVIFR